MKQRINLYRYTARQSVWRQYSPFPQAAIGLVLVLLVLTIFAVMDKTKLDAELRTLSNQHDQFALQLQQLSAINNESTIETLQQSVSKLEADLAVRQATMTSIKAEGAANSLGFSSHLEGLARQHFDGLWLTAIELIEGGERMGLAGFTGEPEMVPRYIRNLSNEKVFSGTEFDVFRLERLQDSAAMAFDVTAVAEVEQ